MHKFDKIILESMVNTEAMLSARRKVLLQKRSAGYDVTHELKRAGRFLERYSTFVHDWTYWYYDTRPGSQEAEHNPHGKPLPSIYDGIEIRIQQKLPGMVLPRAHQIELVLDKKAKKS